MPVVQLRKPYVIFLGQVTNALDAKTGYGLRDWCPGDCIGQMRLPGCTVDLGLPDLDAAAAKSQGAGSVVIGIAPVGGGLHPDWIAPLQASLRAGVDLVAGLHVRLAEHPQLAEAARDGGARIVDVRRADPPFTTGSGRRRSGKRVLTVGTDCAIGKKYTALAIAKEFRRRGVSADFRATGQTGIMIAGRGIAIDTVVSDFIAGAAESLSPDAPPDHWDVVEGQGSLFHPAYAGVALGLLHGSQPDAIVMCHDPPRTHIDDFPDFPLPTLAVAIERNLEAARLTNRGVRCAGVSLNTSSYGDDAARQLLADVSRELGVPAVDPLRTGVAAIVENLLA